MAELIAPGVTQVASADFTLTAGSSTTLSLKGATGSGVIPANSVAQIQYKSSGADYVYAGELTAVTPIKVLTATGTFRVVRMAPAVAFGVDRD